MAWVVLIVGGLLIGLTLGLTGSGGSILTVPVLVYLVGHPDKVAIAESLAIVGGIAMFTVVPYARAGEVDWRSVIFFGLPGILGTYAGSRLSTLLDGAVLLIIFGVIVLVASGLMLRNQKPNTGDSGLAVAQAAGEGRSLGDYWFWKMAAEGTVVGIITGLVGVGGGFLIVPALVLLEGLPMRLAVGTSLAVITMNSVSGFVNHLDSLRDTLNQSQEVLTWTAVITTIALFTLFGVVGSFTGRVVGARINQQRLRKGFALFLVVMGIVILSAESYKLMTKKAETPPDSNNASVGLIERESERPPGISAASLSARESVRVVRKTV